MINYISPLYDFAFAQIFGSQRNIGNTRAFLKTLLDVPEGDYGELTVENPILKRFFRQDKMGIVDLKLRTKSGRVIHIELQVDSNAHLKHRILYYAARLIGDQLRWGDNYGKLHQVVSIVICNHILLDEEQGYVSKYELRNDNNRSFTHLLKLVILELPKLPEAADSGIWPWLKFFKCRNKEEFEMLASSYPELENPVFCVRKMSLLEKWRDVRFHKNLWKEDDRLRKLHIQTEARKEGLVEGREQRDMEIARKMKEFGDSAEKIHVITGLSEETIIKI